VGHGKSSNMLCGRREIILLRSGAGIPGIVLNAVDLNSPEYYGITGIGYSYSSVDSESWNAEPSVARSVDSGETGR